MIDTIMAFSFWGISLTNWLGLLLYWLPAALCLYGYTIRIWYRYQNDYAKRSAAEKVKELRAAGSKDVYSSGTYIPSLTVGSILGYALLTIIPIANLFAAIFDVAPKVFSSLIKYLEKVFNQPLVPARGDD